MLYFPVPPSHSSEYPEGYICPGCLSLDTLPPTLHHSNYPYVSVGPARSRASSESEVDDEGLCGGDGDPGLFPFPLPRGGAQASSEESEEEGTSDDLHLSPDCHYATRPPRPQAVRRQHRELGWKVAKSVSQASPTTFFPSASSFAHLEAGW